MAIRVTPAAPPDPAAWFAETYGGEPDGIWFAPGRVNLMGGPDYTEGYVLPFALGAGVTVAAARRPDRRVTLVSRQQKTGPIVVDIDTLEPGSVPGWAAYPAGVAWALRQAGHRHGGADIAIDADLPAGAGLSSSAALECATALALTELHQLPVPRPELAALARRAENDFAGVPSGIMDQIAALLSRAGHALLLDCRTGTGTPVPLDPAAAGLNLLVIDTRAGHALGDGRYAERRRACEQAASALGVRSLRDVTDDGQLTALSDPSLRRLAGHVLAEQRRVLHAADLLRRPPSGDRPAPDRLAPLPPRPVPLLLARGRRGGRGRARGRRRGRPHDRRRLRRLGHRPRPRQPRHPDSPKRHPSVHPPPLARPPLPGRGALRRRPPPALSLDPPTNCGRSFPS